jgi:Coenzyme PQQ synthesis protein D (PqqD)
MSVPRRRRLDVLWRRSLDHVVVLAPGADEPVSVGGAAPAVWRLLAEARTPEDLVVMLVDATGADTASLQPAVTRALADLDRAGVLEAPDPPVVTA